MATSRSLTTAEADSEVVSVLLPDGVWYPVEQGTFSRRPKVTRFTSNGRYFECPESSILAVWREPISDE
ncbi:Uncharacterised protein [Mycobacteroides abscessus subsp. abscessus]|nr:Uncharacterised protein [Mycobacteroides abscessus subsp. abscessus]